MRNPLKQMKPSGYRNPLMQRQQQQQQQQQQMVPQQSAALDDAAIELMAEQEARLVECESSMGALMSITQELCERMNLIEEMMALMADETLGLHDRFEGLETSVKSQIDAVKRSGGGGGSGGGSPRRSGPLPPTAGGVQRASMVVKQAPMFGESQGDFEQRVERTRRRSSLSRSTSAPPPLAKLEIAMPKAERPAMRRLRRASMQLATRRASMGTRNSEFFASEKAKQEADEISAQVDAALAFQSMTNEEQDAVTSEKRRAAEHEDNKKKHLTRITGTTNAFRRGGKKKKLMGGRKKKKQASAETLDM